VLSSIDQLPFFPKAEALAVFIDEDLVASTKHFQFLTDDHGVPELREHLTKVMTVADLAISMHHDFDQMLDRVLPRYGDTIELPFSDESAAASVRT